MLFNILKYFLILNTIVMAKIYSHAITSSVPPLNFYIRQPHCQKQLMMLFHEPESMTWLKHSVAGTIEECINNECSFEIRGFELGVTQQVMGEWNPKFWRFHCKVKNLNYVYMKKSVPRYLKSIYKTIFSAFQCTLYISTLAERMKKMWSCGYRL